MEKNNPTAATVYIGPLWVSLTCVTKFNLSNPYVFCSTVSSGIYYVLLKLRLMKVSERSLFPGYVFKRGEVNTCSPLKDDVSCAFVSKIEVFLFIPSGSHCSSSECFLKFQTAGCFPAHL